MEPSKLIFRIEGDAFSLWRTNNEHFRLNYDEICQLEDALPELLLKVTENRERIQAAKREALRQQILTGKREKLRQQIALAQAELDAMEVTQL